MNLRFFIARRYIFSKKSTNVINIISGVTAAGLAVGTMALIVVLSVFNGLESLIVKRFNTFDTDLKVTPVTGKTFTPDTVFLAKLAVMPEVELFSETIEENALIRYNDIHHPFVIKGVDNRFRLMTGVDTMVVNGRFLLEYQGLPAAVIGLGVASYLSVSLNFTAPLKIYIPRRNSGYTDDPERAFKLKQIYPVGVYNIDPEIDQYVIVPIDFARNILELENEASTIEIKLKKEADSEKAEAKIQKLFGEKFNVRNRFEQHELIYKIMKSEKIIVFLILTFILLVASFNIIGSLSMLIIEKKDDIRTLNSMGMTFAEIRKMFLLEGWMLSALGAIAGIVLGVILCFLQIEFGLIKMEGSNPDSFIISAYPVEMRLKDFILTLITVLAIGFLASRFPVKYITRKYLPQEERNFR